MGKIANSLSRKISLTQERQEFEIIMNKCLYVFNSQASDEYIAKTVEEVWPQMFQKLYSMSVPTDDDFIVAYKKYESGAITHKDFVEATSSIQESINAVFESLQQAESDAVDEFDYLYYSYFEKKKGLFASICLDDSFRFELLKFLRS